MAKIDFPEGSIPFVPGFVPRPKTEGAKVKKGKGLFGAALDATIRDANEGTEAGGVSATSGPFSQVALESLLDEVHSAGDKLKENPGMELVAAYKKAVRDFLHYVVDKSYAVEQKSSGRNILKRNIYFNVSVIDESLERLAAEIIRNQRDKLEILRRIDEINGMLVDFLR
ncbi:MAG: YaaR family protein [Spirochaetaceae bacterium]|nr:YaaR family protein [Spirochaetaceae bacterium]